MAFGAASMAAIWYLQLRRLDNLSFGFGVEEDAALWTVVWGVTLCAAFAGLHLVVVRVARIIPSQARHPSVVVGCIGGLAGALPLAWAMVVFNDLQR
jgi:hypothetical protein